MYYCTKFDETCLNIRSHRGKDSVVTYAEAEELVNSGLLYGVSFKFERKSIQTFESLEAIVKAFKARQKLLGKPDIFVFDEESIRYDYGITLLKVLDSNETRLTIPSFVTELAQNCCAGLRNITSVTIPNTVSGIGDEAFHNCVNLQSVKLSNEVMSIGDLAFCNCGLESIEFGEKINRIGGSCFESCYNLKSVEFFRSSNVKFDVNCFSNCRELRSIILPQTSHLPVGFLSSCVSLETLEVPEGVSCFYDSCLFGCTSLRNVKLPKDISFIGKFCFSGTKIEEIYLSDRIQTVLPTAFHDSAIKRIYIPKIGKRVLTEYLCLVSNPAEVIEID